MPFDWTLFLKILAAILRILTSLPPETDVREITSHLADAVDAQNHQSPQGAVPHG